MPSTNPTTSASGSARVSLAPLIGGMLAAPMVGGLLGLGLATAGEGRSLTSTWTPAQKAGEAVGCWIMAGLIGLLLTSIISGCQARKVPLAILVASAVRVGVALFDGLFVALIFKPDSKTFWASFLLCGLLCLVVETAWSMLAIRRVNAAASPDGASTTVGVS